MFHSEVSGAFEHAQFSPGSGGPMAMLMTNTNSSDMSNLTATPPLRGHKSPSPSRPFRPGQDDDDDLNNYDSDDFG